MPSRQDFPDDSESYPRHPRIEPAALRRAWRTPALIVLALLLLFGARSIASLLIDYQWWKEIGQLAAWWSMLLYRVAPAAGFALIAFIVFWSAHALAMKSAGARLRDHRTYAWLSTAALLLLAILVSAATVDGWTIMRFLGARGAGTALDWRDPVFGQSLNFYFFDLPFYSLALRLLTVLSLVTALLYWLSARGWSIRGRFRDFAEMGEIPLSELRLSAALESRFLRAVVAVLLLAVAANSFLGRYDMVLNDHGFLTGLDYVNQNVSLPLNWLLVAAALAAAGLVWLSRIRAALLMVLAVPVYWILPPIVNAVYVRPNEISLQKPYVDRHIKATRHAFGIDRRSREVEFPARLEARIDVSRHRPLLENVRLWDWRAFHDTVSQIQPLRPYIYVDSDVDRYMIDGRLRQVMLAPREMDIRQLGDARNRWINPHFIYTHGYGIVVAEANKITADGLPSLFIKDAPPQILTPSFKLSRPELYYAEIGHEPVFVRTAQPEFNYPSGSENVHSRYDGKGGFPISSLGLRIAAAVAYGDYNILLTGYLGGESRMMIRRRIAERLEEAAPFLAWDNDPYLVITAEGRLVWMADGYTSSDRHPYSAHVRSDILGRVNYVRNSVKATVDAYDGTTTFYVFDNEDPIILAYQRLFPSLLVPASGMPADLRAHARSPEHMFRIQAQVYLTFHMQDAEAFYNKVDVWDIARGLRGQESRPEALAPSYLVATLPGSDEAEFLLMIPFTPRGKDNLIGVMMARCDGDRLGELVFLQLPKQELLFGPMQVEARVNQDQNISKDLTLWNQQGSQVVRGQIQTLPVENTFLYVQPIYIQAAEARMPQLKKVVIAMGNRLIYRDTYEQALAELSGMVPAAPESPRTTASTAAEVRPSDDAQRRLESIRQHMRRYRDLASQGKWAEAGKELEALEGALRQN